MAQYVVGVLHKFWIKYQYETTVTILAFVGFHISQKIFSAIFNRTKWYRKLPYLSTEKQKGKLHYETVAVSLLHCFFAVPLCGYAFFFEGELNKDRLYGTSFWATTQFAISIGYFLWDLSWCALEYKEFGFAFTLHGFIGASENVVALIPFVNYYAAYYLLYEISTFFMDLHWLFEKTLSPKNPLVIANGLLFVIAFLIVRNLGGTIITYDLWKLFWSMPTTAHRFERAYIMFGTVALWTMNTYWIFKILRMAAGQLGKGDKKTTIASSASSKSNKKTTIPEKMD